ncbi:ATP-binding protein [bacterium]|nr:ATP-binding protein [bacterium]
MATTPSNSAPVRTKPDTHPFADVVFKETDAFLPPFPQTLSELGLPQGFLVDLALKAVAQESECTTASIANRLKLGTMVTDLLLQQLAREKLVETNGVVGLHNHRFAMLVRGWETVRRLQEVNSYAGAAPVPISVYDKSVTQQVRGRGGAAQHALDQAMQSLVLSPAAKQTLGLVASSGRSLFLSGPPGNGKTAMARALVNAIPGQVWIPYAIEVDGQVIQVYDSHHHQAVKPATDDYDHRWVKIKPPLIVVGGELTIEHLDLASAGKHGYYEAPVQVRANGGLLLVDDLGRQRCSPMDLLNRWIVPLEHRVDYLTLATGKKIKLPFEAVVIFATNLTTDDLSDEAFLRRMGYRLYVMSPSPDTYAEIYGRYAHSRGLAADPAVLAHLEQRYGRERREPKACEPRDLIDRAIEVCKYKREPIRLTREALDQAWDSYFGASVSG